MEIIYRADDGREFYDESECISYETFKDDERISVLGAANKLKTLCKRYVNDDGICKGCPFADDDRCSIIGAPQVWDIPIVTKWE